MTNEYNETLTNYLLGKLPKDNGTSEEIFKEFGEVDSDKWKADGVYLPDGWNSFKYEGLIKVKNSNLIVLYGGYVVYQSTTVRGIITIADSNFNPIKTFYKYDSGTYLRYIQCMEQSEDGTFYLVDCLEFPDKEEESFTKSQKRFIMLNNFTQQINNKYVLKLQKSYNMPYYNFYCDKLFKDVNSSHYIMVGRSLTYDDNPDFDKVRVIELKINVGSENAWNLFTTEDIWLLGDAYVEFENDKFYCKILMCPLSKINKKISFWEKDFDDSSFTLRDIKEFEDKIYIDSYDYNNQSVFINKNEIYFVRNNQRWGKTGENLPKYIGLYYYNDTTKDLKTIFEKYLGDYDFCDLEAIYITQENNEIYIEYNNNINSDEYKADYYFQRLKDKWNPIKISENSFFKHSDRIIYVSSVYNLLDVYLFTNWPGYTRWFVYNIKENYNSNKYNGVPYINTNALISDNVEIYSNNSLVFARNLYNKTLNANSTISTVEIPNTYLNDIDLTSKNLLSETNLTLVEDNDTLRKNVYETLYLNFINSIQILDKNTATNVFNETGSVYLNNSINNAEAYENAKFSNKIKIIYEDNSEKEIGYEINMITNTSADIKFNLYVDKLMREAQIISNDKTTIYHTINLENLEVDKYYNIKQNMEVGKNGINYL